MSCDCITIHFVFVEEMVKLIEKHAIYVHCMLKYHYRVARVQVFVNSIISSGDILLHSKILLCTSANFIAMYLFA
jgi:hypothetical protein